MVDTTQPKQTKFDKMQDQVDPQIRQQWEDIQNNLKKSLVEDDSFDWTIQKDQPNTIQLIAAVDISYSKTCDRNAVAALLVFSYPEMKVVYEDYEQETTSYPYVPGFLAFKEVPVYSILFNRLKATVFWPQLLLVDGNGILHTRNFGAASHIGVLNDLPSIGVGKTMFYIDGLTQDFVKELSQKHLQKAGDVVMLTGQSGKTWGAALRPTDESKNPLIVSIGHKISLNSALECVKACIMKFRIPEPIRQADLRSRQLVKQIFDKRN